MVAAGLGEAAVQALLNAFGDAPATESDDALARLAGGPLRVHERGRGAAAALGTILALSAGTAAAGKIRIDVSLARGLSYYTGAIMEIAVPSLAGSLGGGGRYDNLIGMFLGRDIPACGFSLGLERIIVVMTERGMFPPAVAESAVDVMVTLWNEDARADALALASELRQAGLRVDLYPEPDKLARQLRYASGRSVPFVAIVGDDERAAGDVTVKDLRTGHQQRTPRARVAAFITGKEAEEPGD
jgi:histidyl-tRNA synthetase